MMELEEGAALARFIGKDDNCCVRKKRGRFFGPELSRVKCIICPSIIRILWWQKIRNIGSQLINIKGRKGENGE